MRAGVTQRAGYKEKGKFEDPTGVAPRDVMSGQSWKSALCWITSRKMILCLCKKIPRLVFIILKKYSLPTSGSLSR